MSVLKICTVLIDFIENHRDNTYFFLIVINFVFSFSVIKRINSSRTKKWMCTILGMFLIVIVMKQHLWHFVFIVFLGSFLSVHTNKRQCHLIVSTLMLLYLTVFRLSIKSENKNDYIHMNIMSMMMTCKLAGMAFEINNSFKYKNGDRKRPFPEENEDEIDPKFSDVLHYAFSYFGMLVGPYVRYRTHRDFIYLPFACCSNFEYVRSKVYSVPIFLLFYIFFENNWPLDYALSEEFQTRNFYYKFLYGALQYQKFRFWMYTGLVMAECICAAAGLGAYPVHVKNVSTHGPTTNYNTLKHITNENAKALKYDFKTISNIDIYCVQTSPWISVYNRAWNKSIQYFMAVYVHKAVMKIPFLNKSFITIMLCAYWHGIELGFQIGMIFLPLCTITDRVYITLCKHSSRKVSRVIEVFMYVYQYHIVGYGAMSCLLLDPMKIYKYYSSLLFLPYFFMICAHLFGLFLLYIFKE